MKAPQDKLPGLDLPADLRNPPTRRWDHAVQLLAGSTPLAAIPDPHLRAALGFLRERAHHPQAAQRRYWKVQAAATIFFAAGYGRWMLEALLLGGATPADIAQLWPIPAGVEDYYRALFFDLSEPAGADLYVLGNYLASAQGAGDPYDPDSTWKWIAYVGGFELFAAWLQPAGVFTAAQREQLQQLVLRRALKNIVAAALQLRVAPRNALPLQALAVTSLFTAEAQVDAADLVVQQMAEGIAAANESIHASLAEYYALLEVQPITPAQAKHRELLSTLLATGSATNASESGRESGTQHP